MSRTLEPEDRISHYRVIAPLGAGGMGEVYIVQDEKLERSVALKVLPPSLVRNEERVRRFVTEAKSASSLNHPNIVTIHEIGHAPVVAARPGAEAEAAAPVHYIAMELVTGETLVQKIHHERADLRTLLGFLAQAAEGLSKAHAAGIVHRDLKPANIMVSRDGFAKVLDFGLAKLTEKQAVGAADQTSAPTEGALTGEGALLGTVGYMSPEQVQGKTADHRSDIFSLGCILYEAATRSRPFTADTDVEVMHRILKDKPRPVEELSSEVPGEVRRVIRRCLAKSPDQRFQSMKDVAIELRELVEDWDSLSPSATSAGSGVASGSRAPATAARGAGFWAIVAAAAILGLGGVGFGVYTLLGRGSERNEAGTAFQDMTMSVLMSRDDLLESALSGDGRYLAYVTTKEAKTSLTVRQVRTGSEVTIIAGNEFQIRGISFSRDGDHLYYQNRDPEAPNYSALFQVPSLGGPSRKILFDVDSAASFSPDGKHACFRRGFIGERADSLVILDLESGKERELIRIEEPEAFSGSPAWSPDGKRIAVGVNGIAGGAKAWIENVDVESGARSRLGTRTWIGMQSVAWLPDGSAVLASAFELGTGLANQLYRVAYPSGQVSRLTNDLDGYQSVAVSSVEASVAAIRRSNVDNLWVARPEGGGEAQPITFASGSAGSVGLIRPLPGGSVVYSAPRDNRVYLWSIDAEGSGQRQLTTQGVFVDDAQYAPGAGIVFTLFDGTESVVGHVWRIDPDGGGLRQLTDGTGEELVAVSPTGQAILFARWDETRTVWLLKLDGSAPVRFLEDASVEPNAFSPDGTRVLYTTLEEVEGRHLPRRHVMSVEGGPSQTSFELPPRIHNIQWAPDGKSLTYVDRAQGAVLMRKPLPDGTPEPVVSFAEGQLADHEWSHDGARMVLHRRVGVQDSLWMLEPGQREPTLVAQFKTGRAALHFWAPDEPILYFTYGQSSQDVVMIGGVR